MGLAFVKKIYQVPRGIYLPLLWLVIVLAVGFGYKQIWHKPANPVGLDKKYVSLGGNYFFSVPAKYTANGTAVPGATIVYPEKLAIQNGQSLNDLYLNGTVAVQAIAELKDNNPEAFKAYVKDVLAADLRKNFKGVTDLRPAKQKDVDANEIYALGEGGKHLRANYAINFTQPVLVVAQDRSEAFKTIGFSMEDLKKSELKPDIDLAAQATKEVAQKLQEQKSAELRKNATTDFKKGMTQQQLTDDIKTAGQYLQRPINIVGGLYNGKFFIAQLVFEPRQKDDPPVAGVVSLKKEGKSWKLDGLQLPKQ